MHAWLEYTFILLLDSLGTVYCRFTIMQSDSKINFERMLLKAHKRLAVFLGSDAILSAVSLYILLFCESLGWKEKNASSRPLEW